MKQNYIHLWRGFVKLEVTGSRLERLINRIIEKRMSIWDIRYLDNHRAEMCISIGDFFRLRPLLKETGSRIRIKERLGFPFFLDKLWRRKFFAVGVICFLVGIYLLSSLVWQVRVEGNQTISTDQILQAARQEGIYKYQWKRRLPEPEQLSRQLQSQLPSAAWVGVELQGTHVVIKVVEATIPEKPPLMNPQHLVAAKNAMVTDLFAEKGRPLVKPNMYVRKGDILISGILGDEMNQQTVVAAGYVKGLVWYTPKIEVPLTQKYKVYTGESKKRFYLVFGNRALQITGYGQLGFEQFESLTDRKTLGWRSFALPVGWMHEKVMEVQYVEQPIDPKEARAIGLEQVRSELLADAGKDARVVSEKILHEKTENGKVYMEVHLEIEEHIATEQPIVP
ncbi:sporulation protein YqfD [Paenibacillus sp. GD4]|uniref:sporulation protein YqfD n=1 Tax=Paenibacillus sp. GD4 TaxID=3068890 RepID=UPI0027963F1A|nr:sporulation protein YqfD [Paenibacillus sp. GD4]MDQ1912934.1 sporulation protein YqfD [Paenibacillus sp. GD4]